MKSIIRYRNVSCIESIHSPDMLLEYWKLWSIDKPAQKQLPEAKIEPNVFHGFPLLFGFYKGKTNTSIHLKYEEVPWIPRSTMSTEACPFPLGFLLWLSTVLRSPRRIQFRWRIGFEPPIFAETSRRRHKMRNVNKNMTKLWRRKKSSKCYGNKFTDDVRMIKMFLAGDPDVQF
jgi:hypothetical protein